MTVQVNTSGSQTCTVTTEHTLATVTDARVLQSALDFNASVNGTTPDLFEVRVYGKARSSDTERLIKCWSLIGAQTEILFITPPLISPHSYKLTLKQTQGTGRAVPWAIYEPGQ